MKIFVLAALLSGFAVAARAQAVPGNYTTISYVSSPSVTIGGTAQNIAWTLTAAKIRCVQNPESATEDLFVKFGGTAAATGSHDLPAGVEICFPWNGAVSVYAATTSHAFIAFEAQ